jgi:RNA polymerase sigma-70 factor, ECF subfamily
MANDPTDNSAPRADSRQFANNNATNGKGVVMGVSANADSSTVVFKLADELPDEALIASIANSSQAALGALFCRHGKLVHSFIYRMTGDITAAEDAVGDVFLAVWRNAKTFGGRSQVKTWMLGIARNNALSAMRRRKEHRFDDVYASSLIDSSNDAEVTMQKVEQSALLEKCLGQLSSSHRQAIDLIYLQGKTAGETAKLLNVPRNTVKTRAFHARKRLSKLLQENGIDRTSH